MPQVKTKSKVEENLFKFNSKSIFCLQSFARKKTLLKMIQMVLTLGKVNKQNKDGKITQSVCKCCLLFEAGLKPFIKTRTYMQTD